MPALIHLLYVYVCNHYDVLVTAENDHDDHNRLMATCEVRNCRRRVKRGPKFADSKCRRVGKMWTVILQTKRSIVIILKNREITISPQCIDRFGQNLDW